MKKWRIDDSRDLYNVKGWGVNFFDINEKGHATVHPLKEGGPDIDLYDLVQELSLRDVSTPMLLRFPDILDSRIEKINGGDIAISHCVVNNVSEECGNFWE